MHEQLARLAVGARVHLPHQPVTVQDGKCVVAPAALLLRLVHLQRVVEAEQVRHPLAIVQEEVEGREQLAALGRGTVQASSAARSTRHRPRTPSTATGSTGLPGPDRFALLVDRPGAGEAEGPQAAAVELGLGVGSGGRGSSG